MRNNEKLPIVYLITADECFRMRSIDQGGNRKFSIAL